MPKDDLDDILDELAGGHDDNDEDIFTRSVINRNPREIGIAEDNLRPHTLDEVIGQEPIKRTLRTYMSSARRRGQPLDHVLLYGPPGLGKTTIASVIATEMDNALIMDTGPTLNKEKMMSHVTSIIKTAKDENLQIVLFVDEAHDIPKESQTILLPLLEEFKFIDLYCPKFTFVAATTEAAKLPAPLRDRLSIKYHVEYYTDDDLLTILKRSFRLLWELQDERYDDYVDALFAVDEDGVEAPTLQALRMLAHRAKGVPRSANQLLQRTRDFALGLLPEDKDIWEAELNPDIVKEAMTAERIDVNGLTFADRRILVTMLERFEGRKGGMGVGPAAIASAVGEHKDTIEFVFEPNMVRLGFIERTERGRKLSVKGLTVALLEQTGATEY